LQQVRHSNGKVVQIPMVLVDFFMAMFMGMDGKYQTGPNTTNVTKTTKINGPITLEFRPLPAH
jgi:hypothetical protein